MLSARMCCWSPVEGAALRDNLLAACKRGEDTWETGRCVDAAARKPLAAKPRFGGAKKPGAGRAGGLGVRRMTNKVDDALFEQAPAEEAPPAAAAALSALSHTLSVRTHSPILAWLLLC